MALQDFFAGVPGRDWEDDVDGTVALAVVGIGRFAREIALPAIERAEYCETAALVSGSPEAATETADAFGADAVLDYGAYADGEAADTYDAVYVATPNALHLPHAEMAARLGKDVICEKPLEATVERAERVVEACEDVTLMTAYRMQADPVVRRMRGFVRAGGIGEPVKAHGDNTLPLLSGEIAGAAETDQWRLDSDLSGGGALVDVGVYPLNTARFVLDADPVAAGGTTSGSDPFVDVDARAAFQVDFPDGVTGSFTGSYVGHRSTGLEIIGTDGRLELASAFDPGGDRTLVIEQDGARVRVDALGRDEVVEEFDYFAHCCLTDTAPEPDGHDGLVDVRVVEAVYESSEYGDRVTLES